MGAEVFHFGPTGRGLSIDPSGRLIATSDPVGGLYIYGYGNTGRALVVDASGRMVVSPQSDIVGIGDGGGPFQVLASSSGITVDMVSDSNFYLPLAHNAELSVINQDDGQKGMIVIKQAVGNKTIDWPANFIWLGGLGPPTLTAASGSVDEVTFIRVVPLGKVMASFGDDFKP